MTETPRRRDPERRRREIVSAAVELVLEDGSEALTHRKVAARAGVPLGSTTQYFATLDDLRAAALLCIVGDVDVWLDALEEAFARDGATPSTYAVQLHAYLSDPHLVQAAYTLTSTLSTRADVQESGREWTIRFARTLARHMPPDGARAVAAFSDGLALTVATLGEAPDLDFLTRAVAALWNI